MIIRSTAKTIEEFSGCEGGAHDDDMRGPSPFTTVEILERSPHSIVINTAEEAAQIADCCTYGTFPQFCPHAADRIAAKALEMPGAAEILRKWDADQWANLVEMFNEARQRV